MGLVLRTCLSLIPGNHKSWLLVITKHKCSCSTDYGPVRLPGHFFSIATRSPWVCQPFRPVWNSRLLVLLKVIPPKVQRCACKFWTPFENLTSINVSKVKYETWSELERGCWVSYSEIISATGIPSLIIRLNCVLGSAWYCIFGLTSRSANPAKHSDLLWLLYTCKAQLPVSSCIRVSEIHVKLLFLLQEEDLPSW